MRESDYRISLDCCQCVDDSRREQKLNFKFQAIFIFVAVLLLAMMRSKLAALNPGWNLPWYAGALIGVGFIKKTGG